MPAFPPDAVAAAAVVARSLPTLLHLYWGLATGAVLVALTPGNTMSGFKAAVRLASCRGKTWDTKPIALGPLANASVPQAWFLHFYALGTIVCAAVLAAAARATAAAPLPPPPGAAAALAALALLQAHLARRWAECGVQARYPPGARMHLIAWIFGLTYYTVLPLSLLPSTFFGAVAASLARAGAPSPRWTPLAARLGTPRAPARAVTVAASAAASLSPLQWVGVAAFVAGSALQAASHAALSRLQRRAAAARKRYLPPPAASLLSLCACPHYLGEIVIYAGLALVTVPLRSALPAAALFWVAVNLALAASDARAWYVRTFPAYPPGRAALVPGVW